jgi:hypothetical protein
LLKKGRIDIIEALLNFDHDYSIEASLAQESHTPASPTYLALINDFKDCALWYNYFYNWRKDHCSF